MDSHNRVDRFRHRKKFPDCLNSRINEKKPKGIFSSVDEIEQALESKSISLHSKIISVFKTIDDKGQFKLEKYTYITNYIATGLKSQFWNLSSLFNGEVPYFNLEPP